MHQELARHPILTETFDITYPKVEPISSALTNLLPKETAVNGSLDGLSAGLLGDGTRAYQTRTSTSSSRSDKTPRRAWAVGDVVDAEMQMSHAEVLSMNNTTGAPRMYGAHNWSATRAARSSASKMIVFFSASFKIVLCRWLSRMRNPATSGPSCHRSGHPNHTANQGHPLHSRHQ